MFVISGKRKYRTTASHTTTASKKLGILEEETRAFICGFDLGEGELGDHPAYCVKNHPSFAEAGKRMYRELKKLGILRLVS